MNERAVFFRLLVEEDKASALREAVKTVQGGQTSNACYMLHPGSFNRVPGSPFAYWASDRVRELFAKLLPVEGEGRKVRVGDHPGDGFRYLRLFWEVPSPTCNRDWRSYQKGGAYSPYYSDIHLVADWDLQRQTYRGFRGRPGRASERPSNYQYFLRPGLTWPRRTNGLSFRILPRGCVFADKGPAIFSPPITRICC